MSGGTIYRAECIIGECVHLPVVGKLVQMGREYQIEIKLCLAPLPIWSKAFTIGRCTFFSFYFFVHVAMWAMYKWGGIYIVQCRRWPLPKVEVSCCALCLPFLCQIALRASRRVVGSMSCIPLIRVAARTIGRVVSFCILHTSLRYRSSPNFGGEIQIVSLLFNPMWAAKPSIE